MNNFGPLFHSLALVIGVFLLNVHLASCQTGLSDRDKQELLNAHNHFRGIVDPTASNMEEMVMEQCMKYTNNYVIATEYI